MSSEPGLHEESNTSRPAFCGRLQGIVLNNIRFLPLSTNNNSRAHALYKTQIIWSQNMHNGVTSRVSGNHYFPRLISSNASSQSLQDFHCILSSMTYATLPRPIEQGVFVGFINAAKRLVNVQPCEYFNDHLRYGRPARHTPSCVLLLTPENNDSLHCTFNSVGHTDHIITVADIIK